MEKTDIRDLHKVRKTAADADSRLAELVGMFADDRQNAARRRRIMRWVVGIVCTVATALVGGYQSVDHTKAVQPAEVQQTVQTRTDHLELKAEQLDGRVRRLGERSIEMQVQQVEATEYLADKIDAAHPKEANNVPEPDSLKAAREKVGKIITQKRVDELFRDVDPDRPLEPTAPK
jgi:hypothetical protein